MNAGDEGKPDTASTQEIPDLLPYYRRGLSRSILPFSLPPINSTTGKHPLSKESSRTTHTPVLTTDPFMHPRYKDRRMLRSEYIHAGDQLTSNTTPNYPLYMSSNRRSSLPTNTRTSQYPSLQASSRSTYTPLLTTDPFMHPRYEDSGMLRSDHLTSNTTPNYPLYMSSNRHPSLPTTSSTSQYSPSATSSSTRHTPVLTADQFMHPPSEDSGMLRSDQLTSSTTPNYPLYMSSNRHPSLPTTTRTSQYPPSAASSRSTHTPVLTTDQFMDLSPEDSGDQLTSSTTPNYPLYMSSNRRSSLPTTTRTSQYPPSAASSSTTHTPVLTTDPFMHPRYEDSGMLRSEYIDTGDQMTSNTIPNYPLDMSSNLPSSLPTTSSISQYPPSAASSSTTHTPVLATDQFMHLRSEDSGMLRSDQWTSNTTLNYPPGGSGSTPSTLASIASTSQHTASEDIRRRYYHQHQLPPEYNTIMSPLNFHPMYTPMIYSREDADEDCVMLNTLYWKPTARHKSISYKAVVAGVNSNLHTIYIGRDDRNCIKKGMLTAIVPAEKPMIKKFKLLCEHRLKWIKCSFGEYANVNGAVKGGKASNGETLYIGRAIVNGSTVLGKVSFGGLLVVLNGQQQIIYEYELLVQT